MASSSKEVARLEDTIVDERDRLEGSNQDFAVDVRKPSALSGTSLQVFIRTAYAISRS
jgi:hypothetical protein